MRKRKEVQAIIFDKKDSKTYVLLVKKFEFKSFSSRWRLLKGGVENGETDEQAIRREIREETGLQNVEIVGKVYDYSFDFFSTQHIVSTYLVRADMNEELAIDTKEIIGARWVPIEQAERLLSLAEEKEALRRARLS